MQIPSINPDIATQLLIGFATTTFAAVSIINSRRASKLGIYQSYLDAWHELNNIRIAQPDLRALIARAQWPEDRADQIILEAFTYKFLDILALSYRASKFGAITKKDFLADIEDVVRELGFLAPLAKKVVNQSAFNPIVTHEFNKSYKRLVGGD